MFVWWLIKRAAKSIVDFWNSGDDARGFVLFAASLCSVLLDIGLSMTIIKRVDTEGENLISFWITGIFLLLCVVTYCGYFVEKYGHSLYTQYRDEQSEKPKRQWKNDETEKETTRQSFENGYNAASEYLYEHKIDLEYFDEQ